MATFTELNLNLNDQYELIIAVDGNPNTLYSSFSAANPNGAVQMINLNSQINANVTTIGIEDLPTTLTIPPALIITISSWKLLTSLLSTSCER
ncbi:MAG: hypothetical protein EBS77_07820 [Gammaproteobacteria bacterium]|nr:hypothetical protein [Gammaproteobacteria bacterium]